MPAPRLTVIGLDAATPDVIHPLLESGELPNIGELFERGSRGTLRSVTHPLTPHAWATMVTGVNAARHGVWDFREREPGSYQLTLVNGSVRRAPAVWDYLRQSGRSCGVVNIPFTWPAPEVDGFALAGFDAAGRDEGMSFPPELLGEIREQFGPPVLDHRFPLGRLGEVDLDLVRRAARQKVDVSLSLQERFEPELLFVVFMAADHVQHLCWSDWERDGAASPVAETYRILDEAVGRLVARAGDGNVLLVSDHGAGRLDGVVNLNAWLAENGYLTWAGKEAALGQRAFRRIFELRRALPEGLRSAVKQRLPSVRERAYRTTDYAVVDWSRTRAFAYGTFGNVALNVRGREEAGIVEPGREYDELREELAERLLDLRSPAGERIVAAVHRREDLFHGDELERIPDLVVEFDRYAWLGKGNLTRRSTSLWDRIEIEPGSEHSYVGSHRHEGIVAMAGPAILKGRELEAGIADIAPTILYLLGEAVPYDLDGRVLEEAIDPSTLDASPPVYRDPASVALGAPVSYDEESREEVERRLRGLGYVE